jgi:hypothetical protein
MSATENQQAMQHELFAFYGGPDQVMGVTSGLAGLAGLLMIFWNKVVGLFFRVVRAFSHSAEPAAKGDLPAKTE